MKFKYGWDLQYLESLIPWQRDIYIDLTTEEIKNNNE
jgi:hypothetical protein